MIDETIKGKMISFNNRIKISPGNPTNKTALADGCVILSRNPSNSPRSTAVIVRNNNLLRSTYLKMAFILFIKSRAILVRK